MSTPHIPLLSGTWINLLPLTLEYGEMLRLLANDEGIATHLTYKLSGEHFPLWLEKAIKGWEAGRALPFVVRRLSDQKIIGTTRFYDIHPKHHRVMIGYTWYSQDVWGSYVNPECKYLLLQYAFETWQVNRVEFATEATNARSRSAILKLGANEEGRQRMVLQNGVVRDTLIFSIIKTAWSKVKAKLIERLSTYNDSNGQLNTDYYREQSS